MPKAFVYVFLITLLLRPRFSSDSAIRPWQIIVGKFIVQGHPSSLWYFPFLSTSHFSPLLPSPPKVGGFSNKGFGFFFLNEANKIWSPRTNF